MPPGSWIAFRKNGMFDRLNLGLLSYGLLQFHRHSISKKIKGKMNKILEIVIRPAE